MGELIVEHHAEIEDEAPVHWRECRVCGDPCHDADLDHSGTCTLCTSTASIAGLFDAARETDHAD